MIRRYGNWLAPVSADGLALLLLWWWLPTAVNRLQTPAATNVLLLGGVYILLCAGVYLIRKLQATPEAQDWLGDHPLLKRPSRMVLGVLAGSVLMTALAYQFGYFQSIFEVDTLALGEGESAMLFVFAPGAWLGTSLLYTAFLALSVTSTIRVDDGRYPWFAFLGLLFVNGLLIFLTAQLKAVLALLPGGNGLVTLALAFFLFLLLLGPPRLLYLARQKGPGGSTLLFLIAAAAWLVVR